MSDPAPAARPRNFWYVRTAALPGGRWRIRAYQSLDHPDGTVLGPDVPDDDCPPDAMVGSVDLDAQHRIRVRLSDWAVPGAPDLWFVFVPSTEAAPDLVNLVAYATGHFPDGTVIDNASFYTVPVRSSEQVGALRWWADTGLVDQIFVAEEHRMSHVATKLMYSADGVHQHHGWPGHIHVGGKRTDLGQAVAQARGHPTRIAPWTERSILR